MKITIGVPTRDRPLALARLLASLHAQTYKEWDLVIVNDSSGPMLEKPGEMMLEAIKTSGHSVLIARGARINQAYAHNFVLWDKDTHEYVLRVDDDCILFPDYLAELVRAWKWFDDTGRFNIGAISGTIFTEHVAPRDDHPPVSSLDHGSTDVGPRGESLNAVSFMREYNSDHLYIEAQHLYSSCLYKRDAMRQVGGFPIVYSRGVSYHEETDATYRLHLAGYELYLIPDAKAVHSHEGIGGTRLMSPAEHKRRRIADWELFQLRLGALGGIPNFKPSVAVCSQHCSGVGGGQKLTYSMATALHKLVERGYLECVHLYPLNNEQIEGADFLQWNYGQLMHPDTLEFEPLEVYDVVISIGHEPPLMEEIPPRRHHIHYSLFPMAERKLPQGVDRYIAISEFSAKGVREYYYRDARAVYPFSYYIDQLDPAEVEKSLSILMVGRLIGAKRITEIAQRFPFMELPEGTELHIVCPEESDDTRRARGTLADIENVHLHVGIGWDELRSLYTRCAVLWAPRGYDLERELPQIGREHFGYTPVEALAHYCLPIAHDAGGYQETTMLRWETVQELELITRRALEDRDYWQQMLIANMEVLWRFTEEQFIRQWQEIILSTNGLAWSREVEWRRSDPIDISVENVDVHVGIVSEHPALPTGYGLVCNQVGMGLAKAGFKVHVLGANGRRPDLEGKFASLWPVPRNSDPQDSMDAFFNSVKMDVALLMYSPFISGRLIHSIARHGGHQLPIVSFVSQEGQPAHSSWWDVLRRSRFCVTYCKAAADAVMARFGSEKFVEWVYLGVDHAPFRRYDEETRSILRTQLGWDDKFIIFCVATNKRNKALWKHVQALRILHEQYEMDKAMLVLHTDPLPDGRFGGIDLEMYAEMQGMNVRDGDVRRVLISPTGGDSNPVQYESDLDKLFREEVPRSRRDFHAWFSRLGMIDRYNLADVYLDLSSVEGFGLPLFEAMACGVPCITIDDQFVRSEVVGSPRLLPAYDLDVWTTGANMMLASPQDAAREIYAFRRGVDSRVICGDEAEQIVEKLKWGNTSDKIAEVIRRCLL